MFDIDERGDMDQEKKIRREIANSNERRRMQSINSGFQSLRTLLPHHHDGEKLSKAAILQQTAEYIYSLEQEKTRLLSQNCQLKRLLSVNQQIYESDVTDEFPEEKRKRSNPEIDDTNSAADVLRGAGNENLNTANVTDVNSRLIHERRIQLRTEQGIKSLEIPFSSPLPKFNHDMESEKPCTVVINTAALPLLPIGEADSGVLLPSIDQNVLNCGSGDSTTQPDLQTQPLQMQLQLDTLLLPTTRSNNVETVSATSTMEQIEHRGGPVLVETIVLPTTPLPIDSSSSIAPETETTTNSHRSFLVTGTSRQNLDSIVEAIRHLEGDHLFSEECSNTNHRQSGDVEAKKETALSGRAAPYTLVEDDKSLLIMRPSSPTV